MTQPRFALFDLGGGEILRLAMLLLAGLAVLAILAGVTLWVAWLVRRDKSRATVPPPVNAAAPTPSTPRTCPRCGAIVAADAPQGLCPRCVLGVGLATQAAAPYSFAWTSAPIGSHAISANVLYDVGSLASATNTITVWDSAPPALAASLSGGWLSLQLSGSVGQHYRVEYQPELPPPGPWQLVMDIPSLPVTPFTVAEAATNAQRYYRIISLP